MLSATPTEERRPTGGGTLHRLARPLRWAARAIGLLAAAFTLTMMVASAAAELLTEGGGASSQAEIIQGALIGVLGALGLAGCIVSWWRVRLAGILLVLTAVGFAIHIGVVAGRGHFLVWSIMGLPYLVAGVLLFVSWWLSRKTA